LFEFFTVNAEDNLFH